MYQETLARCLNIYCFCQMALLWAMSECLALVPDEILDSILVNDFVDATTQLKGSFIRCSLVASGRQPISLLNVMVDAAFNVPEWSVICQVFLF